jgi:hypothetical protein
MRSTSFLLIFITLLSCNQKKTTPVAVKEISMLPYKGMLLGEIRTAVETPAAISQYTLNEDGTKKDSAYIDTTYFKTLALNFIEPNIADDAVKGQYIESSFEDLTSNQYNFSYDTKSTDLPVKSLILSFSKANQSNLNSLQLTKSYTKNNVHFFQQLFWRSNQYFTISTLKDSNHIETMHSIKVVWNWIN